MYGGPNMGFLGDGMGQQGGAGGQGGPGGGEGGTPGGGATPDPNSGENYRITTEVNEWKRQNSPAVPYGQTERPGGEQWERIKHWMDKTGWDGDLNWPPPGYLEEEAARGHRLDTFDRQQQQAAGYYGAPTYSAGLSPLQAHEQRLRASTQQAFARHDAWMDQMRNQPWPPRR